MANRLREIEKRKAAAIDALARKRKEAVVLNRKVRNMEDRYTSVAEKDVRGYPLTDADRKVQKEFRKLSNVQMQMDLTEIPKLEVAVGELVAEENEALRQSVKNKFNLN